MSLLDRLLSTLGLGRSDDRRDREPTVTVEHDPDASDEAAVKGVDPTAGNADRTTDGAAPDEAGSTAASSPETDGADAPDQGEGAGAPAETDVGAGETTDADAVDGPDGDGADEPDGDGADEPDGDGADGSGETDDAGGASGAAESVETVKGIGPAYADRLAAAGVETIDDLRAADAADLAERTSLSEKRLSRWIDRARTRLD